MSGEIDFDLPLWGATVYHNTPDTDGVWNRTFNSSNDEKEVLQKVKDLFTSDGFNWVRIIRIDVFPLIPLGEGDKNGRIG